MRHALALLFAAVFFAGCLPGATGLCAGGEETQGTMTAQVGDTAFDGCLVKFAVEGGVLTVTGQQTETGSVVPQQLQITVKEAAEGTFPVGGPDGQQVRWTPTVSDTYVGSVTDSAGAIEITAFSDTAAKGTFAFPVTGPDGEIEVSEGVFDVSE
jgi:hypothetical protein